MDIGKHCVGDSCEFGLTLAQFQPRRFVFCITENLLLLSFCDSKRLHILSNLCNNIVFVVLYIYIYKYKYKYKYKYIIILLNNNPIKLYIYIYY